MGQSSIAEDWLHPNDFDVNNDMIAISDFPETTLLGGTLSLSPGTGPDGRDELLYSPPGNTFGRDQFEYTIVDQTGRTNHGRVILTVEIPNQTLRGHWKLDETSGATAHDFTIHGRHGTLQGDFVFDANSVDGRFNGALEFNGSDEFISLPSLDFTSNTVTITAWVNPDKIQNQYTAILSSRNGGAAILNYKTDNRLGYHWNDSHWGYTSSLSTPVGQWTFVAMVIEPSRVTFYTSDGDVLNKDVRHATHNPDSFYGSPAIGRDIGQGGRNFLLAQNVVGF